MTWADLDPGKPRHRWSFNNENVWLHVYGIDGPGTSRIVEVPDEVAQRLPLVNIEQPRMLSDWLQEGESWLEASHPDVYRWLYEETRQ